jgi:hypothetical protein
MSKLVCESCRFVDIRRWHREGRLHAGQYFSCSWSSGGKPCGNLKVEVERDAVILMWRADEDAQSKTIRQSVPITSTPCRFGERRPWFLCSGHRDGGYCGRRVALLYGLGGLFACRRCYGLAYLSQQEPPMWRAIRKAEKIRGQLGASPNLSDPFPDRPKGMHRCTYQRLVQRAEEAEGSADAVATQYLSRFKFPLINWLSKSAVSHPKKRE